MPPAIVIRRLATAVHEYELVLMLDPETPDERRDSIAQNARGRIESTGGLKAEKAWGLRKLAYEINQRTEADYRFFRFEAPTELLDDLDHNLKITDGVMRFRIFKVDPRSPVIEPPPPMSLASSSSGRPSGGGRRGPGGRGRDDYDQRGGGDEPPPPPAAAPAAAPAPAPAAVAEPPAPAPPAAEPAPAPPPEPAPPAEPGPPSQAE
jgi:small subunit ribosomal protein S6